jgi:DNA repair protein RecN (Recombination protein N)
MLEELRIQNFAIIDRLELTFEHGFNVITGETGAGKSIILDAVELLLGSRVDSSFVRAGAEKAVVEGVFMLPPRVRGIIVPLLQGEELLDPDDPESHTLTLSREVRRNGRSSARVNGIAVSADVMREIGEALVDIHGQSAHLSLFRPRAHIELLDKFADLLEVRAGLAKVVTTLHEIQAQIKVLVNDKEELQRRADRLRYEVEEIEAAGLTPDEETELVAERDRLGSSEQLAEITSEVIEHLNGDENSELPSVVDALMQVATLMGRLVKIDPRLTDEYNLSEQLSDGAQELAITLSGYADKIEFNPNRLNTLEERLELIKSLKRRYKTDTIQGVLDYAAKAADELNNIENSEERLNELRVQEDKMLRHIGELCLRLHRGREKAGQALGKRVVQELQDLRMERTQFEVALTLTEAENGCFVDDKRYAFDATGMDKVEFMMSANPGEPLRPLAKVASGGEAARIMLALKSVLSRADETPLLIFDEIDQGIGGRIGSVVGEKLWGLTDSHQVMVVTHMPQLAGYADKHFHVKKLVKGERTSTQVTPLDEDTQRVRELAAMLGADGDAGLQSARDILDAARSRKYQLHHPDEAPQQKSLL